MNVLFKPERGVDTAEHEIIDTLQERVCIMGIDEANEVTEVFVRHENEDDGNPVPDDLEKGESEFSGKHGEPQNDQKCIDYSPNHHGRAFYRGSEPEREHEKQSEKDQAEDLFRIQTNVIFIENMFNVCHYSLPDPRFNRGLILYIHGIFMERHFKKEAYNPVKLYPPV